MATTTQYIPRSLDDLAVSISTVNLGTYFIGGFSVTPTQLGLSKVVFAIISIHSIASANTATWYKYDVDTNKVVAYLSSGAEVSNGTDLSGLTRRITAFGV